MSNAKSKTGFTPLTTGERLLVIRHRNRETQRQAAKQNKVTLATYSRWERDLEEAPSRPNYGKLEAHERCLLYRRRSGYSQVKVAKALKRCRYWINQMEMGIVPCDELLWYWEQ